MVTYSVSSYIFIVSEYKESTKAFPKVVILNLFQDLIVENNENLENLKQSAVADEMSNGMSYNFWNNHLIRFSIYES